nr:MAG TPA: hypothetical protein [Caudoviricetes sp.]
MLHKNILKFLLKFHNLYLLTLLKLWFCLQDFFLLFSKTQDLKPHHLKILLQL